MKRNDQKDSIVSIIFKGFSISSIIVGAILIFLGALNYDKMPESFYVGTGFLGVAILFYIVDLIISYIKTKKEMNGGE